MVVRPIDVISEFQIGTHTFQSTIMVACIVLNGGEFMCSMSITLPAFRRFPNSRLETSPQNAVVMSTKGIFSWPMAERAWSWIYWTHTWEKCTPVIDFLVKWKPRSFSFFSLTLSLFYFSHVHPFPFRLTNLEKWTWSAFSVRQSNPSEQGGEKATDTAWDCVIFDRAGDRTLKMVPLTWNVWEIRNSKQAEIAVSYTNKMP